jgi:hypothetical protein
MKVQHSWQTFTLPNVPFRAKRCSLIPTYGEPGESNPALEL